MCGREKGSAGAVQNGMLASERDTDGPISSSGGRTVFTLHNTESPARQISACPVLSTSLAG